LNELSQYLLENLILDFEGEVTTDTVRAFLRKDDGPSSRALLQKVIEENGVEDLLITLADVLAANLGSGITKDVIREHLASYAES